MHFMRKAGLDDNTAGQGVYRRAGFMTTDRLHLTLPLAELTNVG